MGQEFEGQIQFVSGQTSSVSGSIVQISGQHVYVESGVHVVGEITAQISGQPVTISGDHVYVESGVVVASGLGVLISGQHVYVESGVHVIPESGQHVQISGQHVFVESGIFVASGLNVVAQSGLGVQLESGAWIRSGSEVTVGTAQLSGLRLISGQSVTVASGLGVAISGQHVYVESGVGVLISGQTVIDKDSGEVKVVAGLDYVQSGQAYRIVTAMKGLESAVSGYEGYAKEARLFTGADAKHIRFHDMFDATGLDPIKWTITEGIVAVAGGYATLLDAVNVTTLDSKEMFLYGVLSLEMFTSDVEDFYLGFIRSYTAGGLSAVEVGYNDFSCYKPISEESTIIPLVPPLVNNTWYHIDIVWTPSYAQAWIDGKLSVTVYGAVSAAPMPLRFHCGIGTTLIITGVSLKPYGDIPLTVGGAVPIAGINQSGSFVPIAVDASGAITISGQHVYVESGVGVAVQSGVIVASGVGVLISGQHVFVESGVCLASGIFSASGVGVTVDPAQLSGLRLISGQAVTVQSGIWMRSGTIVQVDAPSTVLAQVSNNPMIVGALSGGVNLLSAACVSVTVKALSINSGDIYLGGGAAGHMPYSGQGFLLEPGEAINIDIDNMGLVRCFAEVSADKVTYLAVNG